MKISPHNAKQPELASRCLHLLRTIVRSFRVTIQRAVQEAIESAQHGSTVVARILLEETLSDERGDLGFPQLNRHASQSVPPPFAMPTHTKSRFRWRARLRRHIWQSHHAVPASRGRCAAQNHRPSSPCRIRTPYPKWASCPHTPQRRAASQTLATAAAIAGFIALSSGSHFASASRGPDTLRPPDCENPTRTPSRSAISRRVVAVITPLPLDRSAHTLAYVHVHLRHRRSLI